MSKRRKIQLRDPEFDKIQKERKQLPIYQAKDILLEQIEKHDTLVIVGETGSGKTTQIPQFLYVCILYFTTLAGQPGHMFQKRC